MSAETGLYKEVVQDILSAEDHAVSLYLELTSYGENVQIISPLRQFAGGSNAINRKVHMSKFGTNNYCMNTPVVWTKNIYTDYGIRLTNGSNGLVKDVSNNPYQLLVNFEHEGEVQLTSYEVADYLEMAYCLTVHKAQGCEWDTVIIILPASDQLVDRNMVYTALSRCKKRAIVIYYDYRFVQRKVRSLPAHERRRSLLLREAKHNEKC